MKRKRLPNGLLDHALRTEDFSGLTPAEIAEVFGTSAKSVRKTMRMIRRETGREVPHVDGRKVRWYDERER